MTVAIEWFEALDSTSAEARRRAEAGASGPVWIAAGRQTAGHGRRGRAWESPIGNLAASLMLVTDLPPAEAAQISFVAALAASDLVRTFVDRAKVEVKWPNDVMIGDEKCAGILVESGKAPDGRLWLAVGIGINLARPPEISERPATALARHMAGPPPEPVHVVEDLARAFDVWLEVWRSSGFSAIGRAWTERAYRLGEGCTARLPTETVTGTAEGLDDDGALRLRLPDGSIRRITAGDVFFETAQWGA
jgi:BirA family biotin operon repressor/biotin-[acetyl-CoA-carboxylase] ligase